jgi:hypothetical protein
VAVFWDIKIMPRMFIPAICVQGGSKELEVSRGEFAACSDGGCGGVGWRKGIAWLCCAACACRVRSAMSNGSRSILREGGDLIYTPFRNHLLPFLSFSSHRKRDSDDTTFTIRDCWCFVKEHWSTSGTEHCPAAPRPRTRRGARKRRLTSERPPSYTTLVAVVRNSQKFSEMDPNKQYVGFSYPRNVKWSSSIAPRTPNTICATCLGRHHRKRMF